MKKSWVILTACILLGFFISCRNNSKEFITIKPEVMKDKIAGGWAGKMIGVTYGAPTEFRARQKIYTDSIRWKPSDIKGSIWQDDLYVQLTFLMSMDRFGVDAPAKKFQEMFAKAGYHLWHANMQARKNYFDSIFAPLSGSPQYNIHADDIDFQIEADYIGFMCPGMPNKASEICEKIGHIMNYGDGVYGGIFVAALYSAAFFESDINKILDQAMESLPSESDYYKIIKDVRKLYERYPSDWETAWKALDDKWGDVDICGAGDPFNIDAKLNGAYIVMGLLYGDGDPMKTLEITTRCGQDSDCNPSNALAVLGVINGFSNLPEDMKDGINTFADTLFINTDYSFNKAVGSSYMYAQDFIKENGGRISSGKIKVRFQQAVPAELEVAFPDVVFDRRISVFEEGEFRFKGGWERLTRFAGQRKEPRNVAVYSAKAGDEAEITFEGTGISLTGNWVRDGGKADIFVDDILDRTIDTYYYFSKQEHSDVSIWHSLDLAPGMHRVKLVVKDEKRPESEGTNVYLTGATIFRTDKKKNETYKFSFEE